MTGQAGSKGQGQPDASSVPSSLLALAPGRPVSTWSSSLGSQCLPVHPVTAGTSPRPGLTTGFRHQDVYSFSSKKIPLSRTFTASQDNCSFHSLWGLLPWLFSVITYSLPAPCRILWLEFSPRGKYGARDMFGL